MTTTADSQDRLIRSPWPVFAACALSFYIVMFDLAVVNVAFPDILTDFEISRADGSWIVTLYNILFGSLLVVAGKTADRIGRRRVFLAGVTAFGLGALIASVSPGLPLLLVGRGIQGIGAALVSPAAIGLLVAAFPLELRTQTMAKFGAIGALGVSSGPSMGAAVIQVTNWRAAFWIPLLLSIALLVLSVRVLSESPTSPSSEPTDYLGAGIITGGLAALVLGVSRSGVWGWTNPATLGSIGVGLVAIVAFVYRQQHHPDPVVDLTLFRSRSFTIASFSGFIFFGGYGAYNLNNVLFLRQAWSYSVLQAGLLALIGPVTVAALAPSAGRLAARVGFRLPAVVGALIVTAAALALGTSFDETPQPARYMAYVFTLGVGIAGFMATNIGAAVAELPPNRLSIGGAVSNAMRQVGAALGVAILVAVVGAPSSPAELVAAYSRGYVLVAGVMLMAALLNAWQTGGGQAQTSADS